MKSLIFLILSLINLIFSLEVIMTNKYKEMCFNAQTLESRKFKLEY